MMHRGFILAIGPCIGRTILTIFAVFFLLPCIQLSDSNIILRYELFHLRTLSGNCSRVIFSDIPFLWVLLFLLDAIMCRRCQFCLNWQFLHYFRACGSSLGQDVFNHRIPAVNYLQILIFLLFFQTVIVRNRGVLVMVWSVVGSGVYWRRILLLMHVFIVFIHNWTSKFRILVLLLPSSRKIHFLYSYVISDPWQRKVTLTVCFENLGRIRVFLHGLILSENSCRCLILILKVWLFSKFPSHIILRRQWV